jgi:hypothetical protein
VERVYLSKDGEGVVSGSPGHDMYRLEMELIGQRIP